MTQEITTGDELRDTDADTPMTVVNVHANDDLSLRVWIDERHGQDYYHIRESAADTQQAIDDGIIEVTN